MVLAPRGDLSNAYENSGMVDALRGSIAGGHIRLFCVDGVDSESLHLQERPSARARETPPPV
jgi:esterase/lipase superfamily enzyme